jgi:hypothetical protein
VPERKEDDTKKEPFIGSSDRPEVRLDLDTPVAELRVRDLAAILGHLGPKSPFEVGKTPIKDFFDKPFPEIAKDFVKELKPEKWEKPEKEKHEKYEKNEKAEKLEVKELKLEKLENDGVFDPGPRLPPGPDPRLESVIQSIAGLTRQVSALSDQVEELRKRSGD